MDKLNKIFWIGLLIIFSMAVVLSAQSPKQVKLSKKLTNDAMALYQQKKYDLAKDKLHKAVQINPKNVKAHEMLSLLYYIERDFNGAARHAQKAIRLNKKSAAGYYVLGMINYQKQDNEKASLQLKQALKYLKNQERRQKAQKALDNLRGKIKSRSVTKMRSEFTSQTETSEEEGASSYKPYVAVFTFEESNSQAKGLGKTVSEMLITALIQKQKYTMMERTQLEKIMQEQSLSQTGVIDEEAALKVGKLAGLEAIILGSVTRLNRTIEADVRLIDVETAKALGAAYGKVEDVEKIRDLANKLAVELGKMASSIQPKAEKSDSTKISK